MDNHFNKNLNLEFRNTFIFCQSLNEIKKSHFLKNLNNLIASQLILWKTNYSFSFELNRKYLKQSRPDLSLFRLGWVVPKIE
jgi:hypothetical protein